MFFLFQWYVRISPPPVMPPTQSLVSKNISYWTGSSFPGQRREREDRAYRHGPRAAVGRKRLRVERVPAEHVHLSEGERKV